VGDSTQLVFKYVEIPKNPDVANPIQKLVFDNNPLPNDTYKYDSAAKTLTVLVTTTMTSKPGHKVIIVYYLKQGKTEAETLSPPLSFEVTRR